MNENIKQNEFPEMLSTNEAAKALYLKPQTLRLWACFDKGPIKPVRVNRFRGRLLWRKSDILALLNGENI